MTKGRDLIMKGLRYPGRITPGNVRLVGICSECGKSLTFRTYNFPMMQVEPCYSDDGLDLCELSAYEAAEASFDKKGWSCTIDGKTFRYYNSFNCPHCGKPYIDYKKYPEMKEYGNFGCMFINRKIYKI